MIVNPIVYLQLFFENQGLPKNLHLEALEGSYGVRTEGKRPVHLIPPYPTSHFFENQGLPKKLVLEALEGS